MRINELYVASTSSERLCHKRSELMPATEFKESFSNAANGWKSLGVLALKLSLLSMWWNETEHIVVKGKDSSNKEQCHHHTDSLLSSASGFSNYRGLVNLCIILLALSNARVALENVIKYGILIDPVEWLHVFLSNPYSWPNVLLLLTCNIMMVVVFWVEVLLSKRKLTECVARGIHLMNLFVLLVYPAAVVLYVHPHPVCSSATLAVYTIVFLKLISYITVNKWCRSKQRIARGQGLRVTKSCGPPLKVAGDADSSPSDPIGQDRPRPLVCYPDNLTLSDFYYFVLAPTLCYELNFPRSARIRKRFLLKRLAEMAILAQLLLGLIQQWVIPTVNNSMHPFHNSNYSHIVARLLKLAVPNIILWMIFFYWFFHSCLNVVAELLRFGDREFYKDWWNCVSVTQFWQNWNVPVHRWGKRHLYIPMMQHGYSRTSASIAVFLVSAFFHEYLVSVPLRMFRLWAFAAMLGQVPLSIIFSKCLKGGQMANMAVWLSIIIGQPLAVLMYVHDYYVLNNLHQDAMRNVSQSLL